MRFAKLTPVLGILALAACGDDQTAQAPATPPATTAEAPVTTAPATPPATTAEAPVTTAPATPPATTAEAPVTTAPATPPTTTAEAPATGAPAGDPNVTVVRPGEAQVTTVTPQASETTGAVGATGDLPLGTYQAADRVNLRLDDGGAFTMREMTGDAEVTGRYTYANDVLTLEEATGDVQGVQFPVRCRVERTGQGFRLIDDQGACQVLSDLEFIQG